MTAKPIGMLACDDSETADQDLTELVSHSQTDAGPPLKLSGIYPRIDNASGAISAGCRTTCDVILIDLVMPKAPRGRKVFAAPWIAKALTGH